MAIPYSPPSGEGYPAWVELPPIDPAGLTPDTTVAPEDDIQAILHISRGAV